MRLPIRWPVWSVLRWCRSTGLDTACTGGATPNECRRTLRQHVPLSDRRRPDGGIGHWSVFHRILIILTRPAYLPAAPYVGFLAYMQVFGGFGAVLMTGVLIGKQLASVTGSVVAGAVVNVCSMHVLIPRFGVWGATIATVISYAVPQIMLYLILQRRYPIPYPMARFLGALAIQFLLLLAGFLVPTAVFYCGWVSSRFFWQHCLSPIW